VKMTEISAKINNYGSSNSFCIWHQVSHFWHFSPRSWYIHFLKKISFFFDNFDDFDRKIQFT
jgi:hypothetical protein